MARGLATACAVAALMAGAAPCLAADSDAPLASVDLATPAGVALVSGQWRTTEARIVETDFLAPGPDGQPGTMPAKTHDLEPHAGGKVFDDSSWAKLAPADIGKRLTNGRLAFEWYRIAITVPGRIGGFDPTGSTAVFSTSADDYAEVWVDGELPRAQGQSGGSVIKGWNAENRLVIGRAVKPGQTIQLAILGINGPISNPPTNYVYLHYAKLDFVKGEAGPVAVPPQEVNVTVERTDAGVDAIVPRNPKVFKLAEGFKFTEGPIWVQPAGKPGHLLFSDPNSNIIYKYDGALSVFRTPSGYSGADIAEYGQPGSNGLTLDPQGRLTINEHGNRRITRLEPDGSLTVLTDRYAGKHLNSPNDLVYKSDGTLYFTDPPFGLPKFFDDPRKELPFSGVFRWKDGVTTLVTADLKGPNGIAFSPDEKYLYVGDWDEKHKVVMRYELAADGSARNGRVFYDMTGAPGEDAIDGIKIDVKGNLYVSGPGGLWLLSPEGRHLGTIITPKHPHNMNWGDEDGRTLYLAAENSLYRIRLNIPGIRPQGGKS